MTKPKRYKVAVSYGNWTDTYGPYRLRWVANLVRLLHAIGSPWSVAVVYEEDV